MKKKTQYEVTGKAPIPRRKNAVAGYNGRDPKYPFAEMKVGDSFKLKPSDDAGRVRAASHGFRRRHGARFIVRRDDRNAMRCWRVE